MNYGPYCIGLVIGGVIWGCSRRGGVRVCVRGNDRGYSKGVLWGCSRMCVGDREYDMGV